jgi:hypothetical protein
VKGSRERMVGDWVRAPLQKEGHERPVAGHKQFNEAVEPHGHGDAGGVFLTSFGTVMDLPTPIQASTSYSLQVSQRRISSLASAGESGFDINPVRGTPGLIEPLLESRGPTHIDNRPFIVSLCHHSARMSRPHPVLDGRGSGDEAPRFPTLL